MIPVVFDPVRLAVVVAGAGDALARRVVWLCDAGTERLRVFCEAPDAAVVAAAGKALERRLPDGRDLGGTCLMFVTGLDDGVAAGLADLAHAHNVPVNVEDRIALSDFHVPAVVRRGDLLLTVSTGGKGPGLTVAIRERLERRFGPEWAERVESLARARAGWKSEGAGFGELRRRTREWLDRQGWFD